MNQKLDDAVANVGMACDKCSGAIIGAAGAMGVQVSDLRLILRALDLSRKALYQLRRSNDLRGRVSQAQWIRESILAAQFLVKWDQFEKE